MVDFPPFRARVGVALGIISLGLLASAPIQGALLGKDQADYVWIKPIAYSGVSFREVVNTLFINLFLFPPFSHKIIVPDVRCNNNVWHCQIYDCQTERIAASVKNHG